MSRLRQREDEAAWQAWQEGVRRSEGMHALMRRIIDAVDALRAREAAKDRHEGENQL